MTVIHNVSGDVGALLAELKGAVGAGGLVREGDVEVPARRVCLQLLALLATPAR